MFSLLVHVGLILGLCWKSASIASFRSDIYIESSVQFLVEKFNRVAFSR